MAEQPSEYESGTRVIAVSDHWTLFMSGSPVCNYHFCLAPLEHVKRIDDLNAEQFVDLSQLLQHASKALNILGLEKNRSLINNTKLYGYESFFYAFLDLITFETIGGAGRNVEGNN